MANTRNLYNKNEDLKTPELEGATTKPDGGFKYNFSEVNDIVDKKIELNNKENNSAYKINRGEFKTTDNSTSLSTTVGDANIAGYVPKEFTNGNEVNGADNHTIYAKITLDNVNYIGNKLATKNTTAGGTGTETNETATALTQGDSLRIPKLTIDTKGRIVKTEEELVSLPSSLTNTVNSKDGAITITGDGSNISIDNNTAGTIKVQMSENPSFTTVTVTSSEKYKKNIKPFEKNAISLLDSIDVVEYNYKCEEDNEVPHIGFIAENTNELFSSKEKDKHRFVDTVGILIKAVQELNEKIEKIEKEIDKCQKK